MRHTAAERSDTELAAEIEAKVKESEPEHAEFQRPTGIRRKSAHGQEAVLGDDLDPVGFETIGMILYLAMPHTVGSRTREPKHI